jgi:O-antigen chain-terminating methyltransferase
MTEDYELDQEAAERLRETRQQVRAKTTESFAGKIRQQRDEAFLYGDRDLRLFPQLQQHLAEVETLWQVQEQPFQSRVPLLGPLIAWFRERWNRVATKWYVRPLLHQQQHFNAAVVRVLQDLHRFAQVSSYDLVRRMDALFYPLDQGQATAYAWLRDLRENYTTLIHKMEKVAALTEERSQQLATLMEERSQELAALMEERSQEVRTELTTRTEKRLWQTAAGLEEKSQKLAHQQQLQQQGITFLRMKLDRLMARMLPHHEGPSKEGPSLAQDREALLDYDYYRFEDLYRPEEEVREGQLIYLPFFQGQENILDLGCGKGEFLELLRDEGIEAYGVDLNEQMVRICQEKELRIVQEDALQHLVGLPEDSLGGLFAAHLVEHLSPAALVELVQLAHEKLRPGSHLVFETPNPLCIWALVNYFYLDMSHIKPIHPQALTFLLEMHGFRDVEVRYLHPVPEGVRMVLLPDATDTPWQEMTTLFNANLERLNDLLYGHADYAIIARK